MGKGHNGNNLKKKSKASGKPLTTKATVSRQPINQPSNTQPIVVRHESNPSGAPRTKLSALQQKFAKKLEGSRFRVINEQLYTSSGSEALAKFQSDPSLFEIYHQGFRSQVESWPENPLDGIITWLQRNHAGKIIADMGCGDAVLAQRLRTTHTVHSFDLVSRNEFVQAADIANVPLQNSSVDIVVFCLSLMGINIGDFIREANRILKIGGRLKIIEVRSRFEKDAEGIKKFIRTVKKLGFECVGSGDSASNKMFFELEARKVSDPPIAVAASVKYSAEPCLYKRR